MARVGHFHLVSQLEERFVVEHEAVGGREIQYGKKKKRKESDQQRARDCGRSDLRGSEGILTTTLFGE